jgi:flagellar basal-body rod modification protein FlgD
MTSPISGGDAFTSALNANLTSKDALSGMSKLNSDTFLKLLVAQLKYQNPDSPADANQFMAQTAQFTQVEKLDTLSKQQTQLMSAQLALGASSMIGRRADYLTATGHTAGGVITGAGLGSNPTVKIDGTDVSLSQLTDIRDAQS